MNSSKRLIPVLVLIFAFALNGFAEVKSEAIATRVESYAQELNERGEEEASIVSAVLLNALRADGNEAMESLVAGALQDEVDFEGFYGIVRKIRLLQIDEILLESDANIAHLKASIAKGGNENPKAIRLAEYLGEYESWLVAVGEEKRLLKSGETFSSIKSEVFPEINYP